MHLNSQNGNEFRRKYRRNDGRREGGREGGEGGHGVTAVSPPHYVGQA